MAIKSEKQRTSSVLKEFGPAGMKVAEEVAVRPSLREYGTGKEWDSRIFSLRIDADEYDRETFSLYYPLFEKYSDLFTIFINAGSFVSAEDAVVKCRDIGLDVQSHGFYHHTYNDYAHYIHPPFSLRSILSSLQTLYNSGVSQQALQYQYLVWLGIFLVKLYNIFR